MKKPPEIHWLVKEIADLLVIGKYIKSKKE